MRSPARRRENVALAAGLAVLVIALGPWFDELSDRSFAWHMAQHILIMMVAAPLVLLGAPLRRILAVLPTPAARQASIVLRSRVLGVLESPLLGWLALPLTLYVTHFSPFYEAALEHGMVHAFEHAWFFTAALLFWNPALAIAPSPRALPYPARIFYVFVAMPVSAFLALVIFTASHPLYPYYEREMGTAAALTDQAYGAELMWLATGVTLVTAMMALVVRWLRDEEKKTLLADRYETVPR